MGVILSTVKKKTFYLLSLTKNRAGFSVVEVILSVAIFLIFSSGAVSVILQGFEANRLGSEEAAATQFASEGIEAARSIRDQAYTNLVISAGTGVVKNANGVWAFGGTNNTLSKYTRVITIASVQRDAGGNIVASGGVVDANTKKITSTVTWQFGPTRNDSVVLTTYLTNWMASVTNP